MVISIEIPKSSEVKLIEEAGRQGKSIESYAAELLQKAVESNRSFAEILAPFRNEVATCGDDEEALDKMLSSARDAVQSSDR
ncbi:MAG: hypothetical protein SGI77_07340 [Pirellulaceae bacterium]|nr:hypothetical protein [Pirellulaceae bacterium]